MAKPVLISIVTGLAAIASPASAASYVLDLKASGEQVSRFDDGREVLDNSAPQSTVRILEPLEAQPKQSGLAIFVLNTGSAPFNFGPENITIKLSTGATVAMLSYQELLKQQKRREAWQAIGASLAAAGRNMQASQAGYSYGTATYSGNTYGSFGSTPFSANTFGTATYSGYNASAASAAQANANAINQQELQALQLRQAAARADLAQVMKTTTVQPGQVFGGTLQYVVPPAVRSSKAPIPVTLEVRVGDEVHTFEGTLSKAK